MIGSLRGKVIDRGGDEVIIEVGGIGYRVTVTPSTIAAFVHAGLSAEVFVFTSQIFRETDQELYGFLTWLGVYCATMHPALTASANAMPLA